MHLCARVVHGGQRMWRMRGRKRGSSAYASTNSGSKRTEEAPARQIRRKLHHKSPGTAQVLFQYRTQRQAPEPITFKLRPMKVPDIVSGTRRPIAVGDSTWCAPCLGSRTCAWCRCPGRRIRCVSTARSALQQRRHGTPDPGHPTSDRSHMGQPTWDTRTEMGHEATWDTRQRTRDRNLQHDIRGALQDCPPPPYLSTAARALIGAPFATSVLLHIPPAPLGPPCAMAVPDTTQLPHRLIAHLPRSQCACRCRGGRFAHPGTSTLQLIPHIPYHNTPFTPHIA
eukprot:2478362-Rhodomonas_salina.2